MKTWDGRFAGKVRGYGILRNGGDPSNGGDDFEIEGGRCWYPFTDYDFQKILLMKEYLFSILSRAEEDCPFPW